MPAYWWKRLLESGRYGSLGELAAAEKIDRSYLGKMLRLTPLEPDMSRQSWTGGRRRNWGC